MAYLHFFVAHTQNLYFDFKVSEALEYHFICAKKGSIYNCNLIIKHISGLHLAYFCSFIINDSSELDRFHTVSGIVYVYFYRCT